MTEQGKAQIQALAAGVASFVAVVGVGAYLILPRGETVKAPETAAPAPVSEAALAIPRSAESIRAAETASAATPATPASPAPLPPSAAPVAVMGGSAGAPAAAAKTVPSLPFMKPLPPADAREPASSSARVTVKNVEFPKKDESAQKAFVAPKLDLTKNQGTIASTVHYGVSSRADLMSRATGPVNNFSKKPLGQGLKAGAATKQAMMKVEEAQTQIDGAGLEADQKAKLDSNLDHIRQTVKSGDQ